MFINAVYTCQMIGPCTFTDYTLDIGYLILIFRTIVVLRLYVDIMTTRLVVDPK